MLTILPLRWARVQIIFPSDRCTANLLTMGFCLVSRVFQYAVDNWATVCYAMLFRDVKELGFQLWSRRLFLFPMSIGSPLNFVHVLTITTLALVILTSATFAVGSVLNNELYEKSTLSCAILCRLEQDVIMSAVSFGCSLPLLYELFSSFFYFLLIF